MTRSLWPLAVCSSADKAYTHGVSLCSRRHSEDEREEENHSSFLGGRDQELGVHTVWVGSATRAGLAAGACVCTYSTWQGSLAAKALYGLGCVRSVLESMTSCCQGGSPRPKPAEASLVGGTMAHGMRLAGSEAESCLK